ncbi:diaminopimelate epimerase [Candidatus Kinetoplastibacterium desouzaii TCC079E]|uniref:Diaminopimelate epimerase n=1 Tax=Candidatus Kinetoplastidibacterium desouzai TCC079E TaxID=1208919 RepID=M1M4X3_9PROT|nr:diaminopimelate epimerase [Candidatus Kinetoplastibacterium desouzaii]AGF47230.1 diaminopimelate epimerase [Candidatus Kinetoplastibacterium desouzaii TCC079E]
MSLNFTKMHGVGNDFIVINCINQNFILTAEIAKALANRNFGIGADQILLVENSINPEADFRYRIFNSTGEEVENCGNGARCFVKFVHKYNLSNKNPIKAEITSGIITLNENNDGSVTVDMGKPSFDPESLPFNTESLEFRKQSLETLWQLKTEKNKTLLLSVLSISNPHAIIVIDDINTNEVSLIGPEIESHPRFIKKVNVSFMQIKDQHSILLRVYERGAGETLACGTGACASVVSGIRRGLLQSPVLVHTKGGVLSIDWDGKSIKMTGPASFVFDGQISINNLMQTINKNTSLLKI